MLIIGAPENIVLTGEDYYIGSICRCVNCRETMAHVWKVLLTAGGETC